MIAKPPAQLPRDDVGAPEPITAVGSGLLNVEIDRHGSVFFGAGRLRQIVWNLVSNAIKFTAHGTVSVRLNGAAFTVSLPLVSTRKGTDRTQTDVERVIRADTLIRRDWVPQAQHEASTAVFKLLPHKPPRLCRRADSTLTPAGTEGIRIMAEGSDLRNGTGPAVRISRRQLLRGMAATGGVLAVGGFTHAERLFSQSVILPPPELSGIEHIVVLMMENRSFDHLLGWLDGADGRQKGLVYVDAAGVPHRTYRLAPDFQGCGHPDPDHSYDGGRVEYNNGACDGWLRAGDNDEYAIGYYIKKDLPFFAAAAPRWTVCDHYFSAIMAGTFANRVYQHAAQTDRLENTFALSTLPTIWDRLADAGLEGRYYFSDLPFLALWGDKYVPIARSFGQFLVDAAAGDLPHVAFVEPRFLGEEVGASNDDHPFADIRNGQAFMNLVYSAVTQSPAWRNTVFVINYDEWGGFFDHVPPTFAPIPPADQILGNDGLRGFRTPCLVMSPFAKRGFVSQLEFDHTSVLKMIEWRWGLAPLTVRDESANNLAEALQFPAPEFSAKQLAVPPGPFGQLCVPGVPDVTDLEWLPLLQMALDFGWAIPAV